MSDWTKVPFTKCLVKYRVNRKNQVNTSDMKNEGRFPVVDQGKNFVAGFTDEEEMVISEGLPLVIFGDHTRCFKYVDFPFALGADGTKVLKPDESILDPRFFYFACRHLDIPSRGYNRHYKLLKEMSLRFPRDTSLQSDMASLLSQVELAIQQQLRLIAVTGELKNALMEALFTGTLSAGSRRQSEIGFVPEGWDVLPLGELLRAAQYGLSVKAHETGSHPILRMTNQINGRISPYDLRWVDLGAEQFEKFRVHPGDILFNRTNSFDLVGRTAIFDIEGDYVFASYLIRLRTVEDRLNPYFLNHYLNWPGAQSRLKTIATRAVSQSNISATRLKGFPVPVPPTDEQCEIIRTLDVVDSKVALHERLRDALSSLFDTLLHELMAGRVDATGLDLDALGHDAQKHKEVA